MTDPNVVAAPRYSVEEMAETVEHGGEADRLRAAAALLRALVTCEECRMQMRRDDMLVCPRCGGTLPEPCP